MIKGNDGGTAHACRAWLLFFALFAAASALLGSGCGGGRTPTTYALGVYPAAVTLAPAQEQAFQSGREAPPDARSVLSSDTLAWEVTEGDPGGMLTPLPIDGAPENVSILYTAPQTRGTYHVKVTAHYRDGVTKTSTATIEVQ